MEHLKFLVTAARNREVASVAPTSRGSVRQICKPIPQDRPCVVVEYGPGTGAFTKHLLQRLHKDSHLIAIELNEDFYKELQSHKEVSAGSCRFDVIHGDAKDGKRWLKHFGYDSADCIVSGVPFSFLPMEDREAIIRNAAESLADDGRMIVYQVSFQLRTLLEEHFERLELGRSLFNLPPLCVMTASQPKCKTGACA